MKTPSDLHFELHNKIEDTRPKKNGTGDIEKCILYCEKGMDNLKAFIDGWVEGFGEVDAIPPSIYCRDQLIRCYLIKGDYDKALDVVKRSLEYGAWSVEEANSSKLYIQQIEIAHRKVVDRLDKYPGTPQSDFYKVFPDLDREALKWYFANSSSLIKRKYKKTYSLWLPGQDIPKDNIKDLIPVKEISNEVLTTSKEIIDLNKFPDWYVSVSFGDSSSKNFAKALMLAKSAPQFIESKDEFNNNIYQAIFSSSSKEYLAFVSLYELVSSWKSTFVIINGEIMDRKIIGGLNYCYGDKIRSGNPEFCYGASMFTENPFGCHRLQISAFNNPWWSFGRFDNKGVWWIDKDAISKRIAEYSVPYLSCPAFSNDKVLSGLNGLPDFINPKKDANWIATKNSVSPKEMNNRNQIEFEVDLKLTDSVNTKQNAGCLTTVLSLVTIVATLSVFIIL